MLDDQAVGLPLHLLARPADQPFVRRLPPDEPGPAVNPIAVEPQERLSVIVHRPPVVVDEVVGGAVPRRLYRRPPARLGPLVEINPERDIDIRRQIAERLRPGDIPPPRHDVGPGHRHAGALKLLDRSVGRSGVSDHTDIGIGGRRRPRFRMLRLVLRQGVYPDPHRVYSFGFPIVYHASGSSTRMIPVRRPARCQ